jgi:predicted DNA-binding transcriptional regulator YafY
MGWAMDIEKYVDRVVEIIYQDGNGRITQRKVRIKNLQGTSLIVFDIEKQAPRLLSTDRILAYKLVNRYVS